MFHLFFVFLQKAFQGTKYSCWTARRNNVIGYVPIYQTCSANDRIRTYCHMGQNNRPSSYEDIIADFDFSNTGIPQMLFGASVMSKDVHVRSKSDIIADLYVPTMRWINNDPRPDITIVTDLESPLDESLQRHLSTKSHFSLDSQKDSFNLLSEHLLLLVLRL